MNKAREFDQSVLAEQRLQLLQHRLVEFPGLVHRAAPLWRGIKRLL